jgi:hypothetical protein
MGYVWGGYTRIMTDNIVYIGAAAVAGVIVLLWFLRRRQAGPFSNLKKQNSGGDTINAVNSNVNTGAGDQTNN